jgi:preprotein translocase SecE subunit
MGTPVVKENNQVFKIVKVILGVLGFIGVIIAILTVTNVLDTILVGMDRAELTDNQKLATSLSASILGILFLFIAFSEQIDKFFTVMERKEIKVSKKKGNGVSVELIFFLFIAIILTVLAVLLGIDFLTIRTELPLLGKYTDLVLTLSLAVLSILAYVTAFNATISQSMKELKKVHWPTGKQMITYSTQVFSFIIFFSVLFFVLDFAIGNVPKLVDYLANLL